MQKDSHQADSEVVFWLFVFVCLFVCFFLFSSWVWQHAVEVISFAWGVLWAGYNNESVTVLLLLENTVILFQIQGSEKKYSYYFFLFCLLSLLK